VGPNRTCLGEFDITMESGLFLDSQVEIGRHDIIGHVCRTVHVCGTGHISESFIYIYHLHTLRHMSYVYL
jgi:hypothetical protein